MKKIKIIMLILGSFILVGCNKSSNSNSIASFKDVKQKFIDANFKVTEGNLYTDMVNSIYVVYGNSENNNLVAEYNTEDTAKKECDSNNEAGYSVCARKGNFIILYDKDEDTIVLETFNSAFN